MKYAGMILFWIIQVGLLIAKLFVPSLSWGIVLLPLEIFIAFILLIISIIGIFVLLILLLILIFAPFLLIVVAMSRWN